MYNFHDKDCDNTKFIEEALRFKLEAEKRPSKTMTKEELIWLRRNENRARFGLPPLISIDSDNDHFL